MCILGVNTFKIISFFACIHIDPVIIQKVKQISQPKTASNVQYILCSFLAISMSYLYPRALLAHVGGILYMLYHTSTDLGKFGSVTFS